MAAPPQNFILGLDLDGVVADFYGTIRPLAAIWLGRPIDDLTTEPTYGLKEWGFRDTSAYKDFHRWAVRERELFRALPPMDGAAPALRRLSDAKVRIRIITHRLFIPYFHQEAVAQTVEWLDKHGIPYWDLCFMADKSAVKADVYVEDGPDNIRSLGEAQQDYIIFENSTNYDLEGDRATTWAEVEEKVLERQASADKKNVGPSRDELLGVSPEP